MRRRRSRGRGVRGVRKATRDRADHVPARDHALDQRRIQRRPEREGGGAGHGAVRPEAGDLVPRDSDEPAPDHPAKGGPAGLGPGRDARTRPRSGCASRWGFLFSAKIGTSEDRLDIINSVLDIRGLEENRARVRGLPVARARSSRRRPAAPGGCGRHGKEVFSDLRLNSINSGLDFWQLEENWMGLELVSRNFRGSVAHFRAILRPILKVRSSF